jgi:hypothetical protein
VIQLIRAVFARIKAMFATDAMLELEGEIAVRAAERKAALLRLAAQYEAEGLTTVAHDLRQQAEVLEANKSLNSAPAIDTSSEPEKSILPFAHASGTPAASTRQPKTASRSNRNGK